MKECISSLSAQLDSVQADERLYGTLPITFSKKLAIRRQMAEERGQPFDTVLTAMENDLNAEEKYNGWTPAISSHRIYLARERLLLEKPYLDTSDAHIQALHTEAQRLYEIPSPTLLMKEVRLELKLHAFQLHQEMQSQRDGTYYNYTMRYKE